MLCLKDMKYYSKDIGKLIKSLVHEFCWQFTIEETKVCIKMFSYLISNTRRIFYNKEELVDEHGGPNDTYNYEFKKEGHEYKIIQSENVTRLFIDGLTFNHYYYLDKNKKELEGNNNQILSLQRKKKKLTIQRSTDCIFTKRDLEKQKPIMTFNIKSKLNNHFKENNLNKSTINFGEDVKIKIIKKNKNKNNYRFKKKQNFTITNNNNLIDSNNENDIIFYNNNNNSNKFNLINKNYLNFDFTTKIHTKIIKIININYFRVFILF